MVRMKVYTGIKDHVTPNPSGSVTYRRRTVSTYRGFTLTTAQFTQVTEQFIENRDFIVIPHRGGVAILPTVSIQRVVGTDL